MNRSFQYAYLCAFIFLFVGSCQGFTKFLAQFWPGRNVEYLAHSFARELADDKIKSENDVDAVLSKIKERSHLYALSYRLVLETLHTLVQEKSAYYKSCVDKKTDVEALKQGMAFVAGAGACLALVYVFYKKIHKPWTDESEVYDQRLTQLGVTTRTETEYFGQYTRTKHLFVMPQNIAPQDEAWVKKSMNRIITLQQYIAKAFATEFLGSCLSIFPLIGAYQSFKRYGNPQFADRYQKYSIIAQKLDELVKKVQLASSKDTEAEKLHR